MCVCTHTYMQKICIYGFLYAYVLIMCLCVHYITLHVELLIKS